MAPSVYSDRQVGRHGRFGMDRFRFQLVGEALKRITAGTCFEGPPLSSFVQLFRESPIKKRYGDQLFFVSHISCFIFSFDLVD